MLAPKLKKGLTLPPKVSFGTTKDSATDLGESLPPQVSSEQQQHESDSSNAFPILSRAERKAQFGIDTTEAVHFSRWEPGGEYVKQLIVKNVAMRTQKIKYKLPQTRFFSMEFPVTVTLSAGMSWTVPITFRPVAKEGYTDVILFSSAAYGKFALPIKATLPEHSLDFPKKIDFDLCPGNETATMSFTLRNTGELRCDFEWEVSTPFSIYPKSGVLESDSNMEIKVDFHPKNASVFSAVAACRFGDRNNWEKSQESQAMEVDGIGKFSHIMIEGEKVDFDFGNVSVGKIVEKTFTLCNLSPVPANFRIKPSERDTSPYFEFSAYSGCVGSNKKLDIQVRYTPVASSIASTDYFDITTLSGNTIKITCSGYGVGPKLALSTTSINFGDLKSRETVARAFHLTNSANCPANFQFCIEPNATFQIDKLSGVINPNSTLVMMIKFTPTESINYYRRIYILVENQDALYLDVLGTGFEDKKRPATFHTKFLDSYHKRLENGLWSYSPEQLEDMLKNGILSFHDGTLTYVNPCMAEKEELLDESYADSAISSEFFFDNMGSQRPVTLLDSFLDFGSCSRFQLVDSMTIRVSNHTRGKVTCVWIMPGEPTGEEPVFQVHPKICDIASKSVAEFKVSFRPSMDNGFYGQQLECYVFFKSMRNFRLVNDMTFTPPWCLTTTVAGNTFPSGEDTFIPKVSFGSLGLDFPACHSNRSVYRSVQVSNLGDTPVKFGFLDNGEKAAQNVLSQLVGGGKAFQVKPRCGLLRKNESQLMVFRFSPAEAQVFDDGLQCYFNSNLSNSYQVQMKGVGYAPKISFEPSSSLVFKPICVGSITKRSFKIRNNSRIPVKFAWKIPRQFFDVVSMAPMHGELPANGTININCTFMPEHARKYSLRIPCLFSHDQHSKSTEADVERMVMLNIVGNAMHGNLSVTSPTVNFEAVLIHSIVEKEIVIYNPCECDVYYRLEITKDNTPGSTVSSLMDLDDDDLLDGEQSLVENNLVASQIEIVQPSDVLSARSHHYVKIRLCLSEQREKHFKVSYRLQALNSLLARRKSTFSPGSRLAARSKEKAQERVHLCDVRGVGVYPNLRILDIRSEGLPKSTLWKLFSLDELNTTLKTVATIGRASAEAMMLKGPITADFDFGAAPLGASATEVHLAISNSGVVPLEWMFCFSNDLDIEVEHWADPGDYTEEQIQQNLILDNEIFNVKPKAGTLQPGEFQHIVLTYNHDVDGTHRIPVVVRLKNAPKSAIREILLNFIGNTVPVSDRYIHFHSTIHKFSPIAIGTIDPPVQSYALMNMGDTPLEYEVDLSPLEKLFKDNNNFQILRCFKSRGYIPPGESDNIEFVFQPLEAKTYDVDLPIYIFGDKSHVVTFSGTGIRERLPADDEELAEPLMYLDVVPPAQNLRIPNQCAELSRERLVFGHMPAGALARHLVLVRNTSKDATVTFRWLIDSDKEKILKINPGKGILAPGEAKVCRVTLDSGRLPMLTEFDVACEVSNENERVAYDQYKKALKQQRREMKVAESLAKIDDPVKFKSMIDIQPCNTDGSVTNLSQARPGSIRGAKYSTLPPIKDHDGRLPSAESDTPMTMLSPPEPFHLHLAILARTYTSDEYRQKFKGYEGFFFERKIDYDQVDEKVMGIMKTTDLNVVSDIVLDLLDSVFQDGEVQNQVQIIREEGIPQWEDIVRMSRNKPIAITINEQVEFMSIPEFQNIAESILENTLFNLLQEVNVGEFDLTSPPKYVAL